jgi:hypothetical protein
MTMNSEGGCYCGELRYRINAEPLGKGMCFCRECQHISGGGPNIVLMVPADGFAYTKGAPQTFTRSDLQNAVTREFCARCGTQLVVRAPMLPGVALIKVGTLDDPAIYGMPQIAAYTSEMQSYHVVPEGVVPFEKFPAGI